MGRKAEPSSVRQVESLISKKWVLKRVSPVCILTPVTPEDDMDPKVKFHLRLEKDKVVDKVTTTAYADLELVLRLTEIMEHSAFVWELIGFLVTAYAKNAKDFETDSSKASKVKAKLEALTSVLDDYTDAFEDLI